MEAKIHNVTWDSGKLARTLTDMRLYGDDFMNVEAKRAKQLPTNLPETTCAFANMPEGGTILLGVDESQNFAVTGIDEPAEMSKSVVSQTRNCVEPAPQLENHIVEIENKKVVVVTVLPIAAEEKPARYKNKAYLRQSDGDYVMNASDLQLIKLATLQQQRGTDSDAMPVAETSAADLNQDLAQEFAAASRARSRHLRTVSDDGDLLRINKVILPNGELSVAGLYGLGLYPQGAEPSLRVTASIRRPDGSGGPRNRNLETFDGPVPDLLESAVDWVSRSANRDNVYQADGHMRAEDEFPPSAIREAVANALVHRDLSAASLNVGKGVEIRLSTEALIITSPGGLRGLSVEQLERADLAKAAVNQRLYEMMRRVKTPSGDSVIEGEGGGVTEILRACRDSNLRRPQFFDTGVEFKVIFWRYKVLSPDDLRRVNEIAGGRPLNQIQKELVLSLAQGKTWSTSMVRRHYAPLGMKETEDLLTALAQWGLAEYRSGMLNPIGKKNPTANGDTNGVSENLMLSLNEERVLSQLLLEALQFKQLEAALSDLSAAQIRYALNKLQSKGLVEMKGSQGMRSTTYRAMPSN